MNEHWEERISEDVIFVSGLRRNLFSEGVATRKGYVIIRYNKTALTMRSNEVVMFTYVKKENLFELGIKSFIQESCDTVQPDFKVW